MTRDQRSKAGAVGELLPQWPRLKGPDSIWNQAWMLPAGDRRPIAVSCGSSRPAQVAAVGFGIAAPASPGQEFVRSFASVGSASAIHGI